MRTLLLCAVIALGGCGNATGPEGIESINELVVLKAGDDLPQRDGCHIRHAYVSHSCWDLPTCDYVGVRITWAC